MAYAALVSLAQTIDLILNYHQRFISLQLTNRIISIDKYVNFLQVFLEDFPDKASSFEGRIREATHKAEEIIEFSVSKQILKPRHGFLNSTVRSNFNELKRVTKEIETISEEVMKVIENSATVEGVRLGDPMDASSSSRAAPSHTDAMVGFDDDLMELKLRLCGGSSKLEVVPIVGMAGIGKTTLARNAYDDRLITEHFDIRAWVTVSQEYSVQEIVSCLLASMTVFAVKNKSMGAHTVYQNLKGRRYFIVLDDIWRINAWDDLKMMFPDDGNGSRVMLTTRLSDVASYAGSYCPVLEMRLLEEDQSWTLLLNRVFRRDPCPDELECVGKAIARSCGGLPLAIVVISGLLTVDQTKSAWENVAKNVKSAISANDEILSLSYAHLPQHLRPCFLYLGGFPEDHEISVSKLVKLWVAEGFLRPNGPNRSFEETAEEYLEDLLNRHLVAVTKRKPDGRIKSFSMHDVMREMCVKKSKEENFILHVPGLFQESIKIPPRLCISSHLDLDFPESVRNSNIRTIIWLKHHYAYNNNNNKVF